MRQSSRHQTVDIKATWSLVYSNHEAASVVSLPARYCSRFRTKVPCRRFPRCVLLRLDVQDPILKALSENGYRFDGCQRTEGHLANHCRQISRTEAEESAVAANAADFGSFARDAVQYSRAADRRRAVSRSVRRIRRGRDRSAVARRGARHVRGSIAEDVRV